MVEPLGNFLNSRGRRGCLADTNLGAGEEGVRRQVQIERRRALSDAAGGIVLRAVAGAEPAIKLALVRQRDAAEMGADADHHQPLFVALLDAFAIRLGIAQRAHVYFLRKLYVVLGAVEDEDGLGAPENLDDLSLGDRSEIDLDGSAGGNRRSVGVHLRDQRHQDGCRTHRANGAGGDIEKIAARVHRRRHGRHVLGPLLRLAVSSARSVKPPERSKGGGTDRWRRARWAEDHASVAFYWHPCRASARADTGKRAKPGMDAASGPSFRVKLLELSLFRT